MQDQIATLITNAAMIKFFITVLALAITLYIGIVVERFVKSLAALRTVLNSFRVSKGVVLRFSTATGTKDGMLIGIDRKRTEIEFDDTIRSIRTTKFAEMDWEPVKPGKDTMKIRPSIGNMDLVTDN